MPGAVIAGAATAGVAPAGVAAGVRPRRSRTAFTSAQVAFLEDVFRKQPQPDPRQLGNIATTLLLSSKVIIYWFQNRRSVDLSEICLFAVLDCVRCAYEWLQNVMLGKDDPNADNY